MAHGYQELGFSIEARAERHAEAPKVHGSGVSGIKGQRSIH